MSAPFAAIETATATSALAAFANCSATLGGVAVSALFDPEYQDAFGIVGASRAALLILTTSAGSSTVGTSAVIDGVTWTVAERQDNPPDQGRGWTRLYLKP